MNKEERAEIELVITLMSNYNEEYLKKISDEKLLEMHKHYTSDWKAC